MVTTPGSFTGTKEEAKINKLVRAAEIAKLEKVKDRFNLKPVAKGFVRGMAIHVRQHEEPGEFGVLQVIEFELSDTPKGPGIPVRMAGTYFNHRLIEGSVLDVPDPTPHVRPIATDVASHPRSRTRGRAAGVLSRAEAKWAAAPTRCSRRSGS